MFQSGGLLQYLTKMYMYMYMNTLSHSDRMADDVSYQRMLRALAEAEALAAASTPALVRVLLGLQKPTYGSILSSELDLHNTGLNEPQREAIRFALGAHERK